MPPLAFEITETLYETVKCITFTHIRLLFVEVTLKSILLHFVVLNKGIETLANK